MFAPRRKKTQKNETFDIAGKYQISANLRKIEMFKQLFVSRVGSQKDLSDIFWNLMEQLAGIYM